MTSVDRSRTWVFTHFVPDYKDEMILTDDQKKRIKYLIYQIEECPSTKKRHYQGYVVFNAPNTMAGVKSIFGKSTHCEKRNGTHEQAVAYCSKNETRVGGPFIIGEHNEQGKRNDLLSVIKTINESDSPFTDLIEQHPQQFIKFHRGLTALIAATSKKRDYPTELWVYFGAPGTGKTRTAYEAHNKEDIYFKDDSNWWDGYIGQPIVIIDDFAPGHTLSLAELLRLADRYPKQCQIKGGMVQFLATRLYITSNYPIDQWFPNKDISALKRRIANLVEFKDI